MKIKERFNLKTLKLAFELMGKRKRVYILCIALFCIVEFLYAILEAYGMKGTINGITTKNIDLFWYSLSLIMAKNLLWWIYAPISSYICSKASIFTMRDFKSSMCEHIVRLPMSFHDKKLNGDYISLMTNDMNNIKEIYDWSFFLVLRSFTGGVGGLILMIIIDLKFSLIVIGFGILSVYISSVFSKKLEVISEEKITNLDKSSIDIYELVKAAKTIRTLNLECEKSNDLDTVLTKERNIKMVSGRYISKLKAYEVLINKLSYVVLLIIGTLFVYYKLSDWGTITALIGLKYTADMLFVECGQYMAGMQKNIVSVERLIKFQGEKEEEECRENKYILKDLNSSVEINNICFKYDNSSLVINNFSLLLNKSSLVVLLGESGSGKSTIIKLLMGLYAPIDGQIVFSGNEELEKNATLYEIRQKTSYVPQMPMLFNGTIFENIAFGEENVTFEDAKYAATLAGADKFIEELEHGYYTLLNDDGNNLSGGQKKRIALARALVKKADILLLDEITSELDKKTEEQILHTIKNISKQKTVLFVTHNKSIIKYADEVVNVK